MQSKGISLLFFVILPKSNNVMTRLRHYIMAFIATFLFTTFASGQSINPTASYIDENGDSATLNSGDSYSGSAPLAVHFAANASETDGYTAYYEWRIYSEQDETSPLYTRYEENTDFTFNQAGSFRVYLIARFTTSNGEEVAYGQEDFQPITISISESELNMPNAFSPNGDGINDIYKPKSGYKSIVKFDAYIFNRWGVKLFEWHDPSTGWDGTYKGKPVKDGVYFCLVKAEGADGRKFNIKKDVNVLRGYIEGTTVTE